MRKLRDGAKWIPGIVIERTGPVSYRVHKDQLLEYSVSSQSESVPEIGIVSEFTTDLTE